MTNKIPTDEIDITESSDPELAKRMEIAFNNHPRAPEMNMGRLSWLRNELKLHGLEVTMQTVHRWYHGNARPRLKKLKILSQALGVDPAWLAHGSVPELEAVRASNKPVVFEGVQNCVMGFIQMSGSQCAVPEMDDPNRGYVHFYAIIKGRQHKMHVLRPSYNEDGDEFEFKLPTDHDKCVVLGAIDLGATCLSVVHLSKELIAANIKKTPTGSTITVSKKGKAYSIGESPLAPIKAFDKPLIQ